YGYSMPETEVWDSQSIQVVRAFQLHFRPENINGEVDLETYAILKALNKKYE
ncbi:MAG: peptidoglycan-binding protein, partial [Fusobacteriaceae bacterium]